MYCRHVFKDETLLGYIAQDKSEIFVRAINKNSEKIIRTLITPIKVDIANVESDISVSNKEIIMTTDERWLSYLEYIIPYNFYISSIRKISKKAFSDLRLGK